MTPDPIGLLGMDPNLYGYALNNPIMVTDPLGLSGVSCSRDCERQPIFKYSLPEYYAKFKQFLEPYVVGGGFLVAGGVVTYAGIITTGVGYGSMPATGPFGFIVGTSGLVVTGVGGSMVTVGLDIYVDEFRCRFDLPEWVDVIPNFELLPHN